MKNIRTISRGNNGVALQFAAKKSSSEIQYSVEGFNFTAPIYVNGVEVSGADLQDQIDTINSELIVIDVAITGLVSDLSAVEGDVSTLQTDLATAQSDIVTLQGEVSTLQSDYTALEARVAALENA